MFRQACAAIVASLAFATMAMAAPKSAPKQPTPIQGYPSHCEMDEMTVFSCSIGRKVASLCVTDDIGPTTGRMRYVFGRMDKPEFIYSAARSDPRKTFTYGLMAKGDYVRFRNGNVSYVVFSHTRPDVGDVEGVVVTRPGRRPITLACDDGALGQVGWGPVYKAQLPRDEEGFDGPP